VLDIVRDIGTFWKENKAHIWLPNIKQGFFGITRPTEHQAKGGPHLPQEGITVENEELV
jgi:hypothetical protein